MSAHVEQTIADFQAEIEQKEMELVETKQMVNKLCAKIGRPPMYADTQPARTSGGIRRDQWYGQPISTAIREYLTMRRAANQGPATVNEIYTALVDGGFSFEARDADNAKRGLRISLTKNTAIFHRLPDGKTFGLLEWYPEAKARKSREPLPEPHEDGSTDDPDEQPPEARSSLPRARLVEKDDDDK